MLEPLAESPITTETYHRLIETGVLGKDDRVELIRGALVAVNPMGPPHATMVSRCQHVLGHLIAEDQLLRVQCPIELPPDSEPEPDLAIVRGPFDRYETRHPRPEDVALLIEVAHSSLASDRRMKIPLYAERRIPEVWLVDVAERRIETYADPGDDGYRTTAIIARDGDVRSPTAGLTVAVVQLVG